MFPVLAVGGCPRPTRVFHCFFILAEREVACDCHRFSCTCEVREKYGSHNISFSTYAPTANLNPRSVVMCGIRDRRGVRSDEHRRSPSRRSRRDVTSRSSPYSKHTVHPIPGIESGRCGRPRAARRGSRLASGGSTVSLLVVWVSARPRGVWSARAARCRLAVLLG